MNLVQVVKRNTLRTGMFSLLIGAVAVFSPLPVGAATDSSSNDSMNCTKCGKGGKDNPMFWTTLEKVFKLTEVQVKKLKEKPYAPMGQSINADSNSRGMMGKCRRKDASCHKSGMGQGNIGWPAVFASDWLSTELTAEQNAALKTMKEEWAAGKMPQAILNARIDRMTEHLSLTADQKTKVTDIIPKNSEKRFEKMTSGKKCDKECKKEMKTEFKEIEKILTPEQKKIWKAHRMGHGGM